jgi:hypothetical protein
MIRKRVVEWVVLAASIVALLLAALSGCQTQSYARCQAHYNDVNNIRTRALTDVADQERAAERAADDAERALFTDPAAGKPVNERTPGDQTRLAELFKAYQDALVTLDRERREADDARKRHPVPPPPSETCGS